MTLVMILPISHTIPPFIYIFLVLLLICSKAINSWVVDDAVSIPIHPTQRIDNHTRTSPLPMDNYTNNVDIVSTHNDTLQCIDNSTSPNLLQAFVVSDVDGSLVHYSNISTTTLDNNQQSLLFLPPSSTGLQAHISIETLRLCQQLRRTRGTFLVLVSGMRTKTLFQRLPFLPRAHAYASENGGRIFYPKSLEENVHGVDTSPILHRVQPVEFDGMDEHDKTEFGIVEDVYWRHYVSQPIMDDDPSLDESKPFLIPSTSPLDSLQTIATALEQRNFTIDKTGYSTCFRVNWKQQRQDLVTRQDFDSIPSSIDLTRLGLQYSINLGCIDFFPLKSGKKNWYEICEILETLDWIDTDDMIIF